MRCGSKYGVHSPLCGRLYPKLMVAEVERRYVPVPYCLSASVNGDQVSLTWTGTATSYQIEVENESTEIKAVPEQTASSPFVLTLANGSYKFKSAPAYAVRIKVTGVHSPPLCEGTSNPNGGR